MVLDRLSSVVSRLAVLVGIYLSIVPQGAIAQVFTDNQFSTELVGSLGSAVPTVIAWSPDGRMFIAQKDGIIRIVKDGALLTTPFLDFSHKTNRRGDLGLRGIAFHPDFTNNGWVYLAYVYEPTGNPEAPGKKVSRVSRVTADPLNRDIALPNSEVIILGTLGTTSCDPHPATADCMPADDETNAIGTLRFGPDGKLFVGNGDGASPVFADPNALRAQNLDSLSGKILRVNDDGSAATDNPFYDGTNSNRSKVWAYGVRNPYGFVLHPVTSEPWTGDAGWETWEEIDRVARGANLGWPCFEGAVRQPQYTSLFTQCGQLSPEAVLAPVYFYDHNVGSRTVGGTFYTATVYPTEYRGSFYFADFSGDWILRAVLGGDGSTSISLFAIGIESPMALELGPDGLLYYASAVSGEIRRIRYNGPTAVASAVPSSGHSPLTVNFSSAGSKDPLGGTALTYLWDFGDGATSTAANPVHTYSASGTSTFTAALTVTASGGIQTSTAVRVTVGSLPPLVTITAPANGTFVAPGQLVNYQGFATDPDEGLLPPTALKWTILRHHNTHVHTLGSTIGSQGALTIESHGSGRLVYEIILTATDSSGLSSSASIALPLPNTTDPPTAPGAPVATPVSPTRIELSWAPSTGMIGILGYRVERCTGAGCTNFVPVGSPSTASFTDPGLNGLTTYVYRVRAVDAASNISVYSSTVTVTTLIPPHLVGLVAAYGLNEGAGATSADRSPSGNLLTLGNGAWVAQGKFGSALAFTGSEFATVDDANSLDLTSGLTLEAWVYPTTAATSWSTIILKERAGGLTYSMYAGAPSDGAPTAWGFVSSEEVSVSGTAALPVNTWTHLATTYDGAQLRLYVNGVLVGTQALAGSLATSDHPLRIGGNAVWGEFFSGRLDEVRIYNRVLTPTEIQADMNRPIDTSETPTSPQTLNATAVTANRIDVAWTAATDDIGVVNYEIERCLGSGCSAFVQIATVASLSYSDNTVSAATTYVYRVRAVDGAQNTSGYSPSATATTPQFQDVTTPGAPGALTASAASQPLVNLSWGAATDNVAVTSYRVERCTGAGCSNFVQIATPATNSYTDSTVAGSTSYRYRVRAVDAATNTGAYSNTATATTPDTQAPSAPGALTASAASQSLVNLSWGAATDNVAVTGYRVERCTGTSCTNFTEIAAPTGTTFSDTTVVPQTTFSYRVRAADAPTNLGPYSNTATALMPSDIQPPAAPGTLTAAAVSNTQVNLVWGAATDNVAVTGYRIERCTGAGCTTFAEIATPTNTAYNDLSPGAATTNVYRVRAVDAVGNLGPYSNLASAETTPQGIGLVAAYSFSEGAGASTLDTTGNGNTGGIGGAAWTNQGRFGNALSFTGSQMVTIADANVLDLTNGMTLEAWVYPTATTVSWESIVSKEQPGDIVYGLYTGSPINRPASRGFVSSLNSVFGVTAIPMNTWTHLATTYDGTMLRLFVNGVQVWTQGLTGNLRTSTGALTLGGNALNQFFRGRIDEVRIYNRALDGVAILNDMYAPIAPEFLDTTAPQAPGTPTATVNDNRIDLNWSAATDDIGVASYRIERCTGIGCSTFAQIGTTVNTTYSEAFALGMTTYVYRVRAVDAATNLGTYSATATVTTPVLDPATVIQGKSARWKCNLPGCDAGDWIAAVIDWPSWSAYSTNARSGTNSRTVYSQTGALLYPYMGPWANGCRVTTVSGITLIIEWQRGTDIWRETVLYPGQTHTISLSGVENNAMIETPDGITSFSARISNCNPQPIPDPTAPGAPGTLSGTASSSSQINLTWGAATDNVGVTGYLVERCTGEGCSNFVQIATPGGTSYTDASLAANTTYVYRVRAADAVGNQGPYSNTATVATPAPPDTEAPGAPGTLSGTAPSSTQINLTWGAATDNVGVTGYRVERCAGAGCTNFAEIAAPTGTTFSDTTVVAFITFRYRARAVDAAANLGAYSNIATIATPAPPDTQAPGAPGALNGTVLSSAQISLTWNGATDNVGVTAYWVERCTGGGCTSFAQIATPTGTTYTDSWITANTTYSYRVRAVDAAANQGPYSNTASITTPAAPPLGPGVVAAFGFNEGSGTTSVDSSGSGNTTLLGNAAWVDQGKFGSALSFTGSEFATVNDANSLDLTGALTLEAWVYPTVAATSWTSIILKERPEGMTYSMYSGGPWNGVPTAWGFVSSEEVSVSGTAALPVNTWTHLATTYDGAQLRLYVNGELAGTQALSGALATSTGDLRIGGNGVWGEFFVGRLDEVRIYNRVLTATEIQADMSTPLP
jgi:glucose/arabinose dehydrogenase/fibronectin type 3 domain-containing protein